MTISDLILQLQQLQFEHGDIEVYTVRSDMGDYEPELTMSHRGFLYIG